MSTAATARPHELMPPPSRWGDRGFRALTLTMALAVVVLVGLVGWALYRGAALSIHKFGWHFIVSSDWDPVAGQFGVRLESDRHGRRIIEHRIGHESRHDCAHGDIQQDADRETGEYAARHSARRRNHPGGGQHQHAAAPHALRRRPRRRFESARHSRLHRNRWVDQSNLRPRNENPSPRRS